MVTACVFAGGLVGALLHPILPQSHLKRETQDVVKLDIGMLSVLASLVLGCSSLPPKALQIPRTAMSAATPQTSSS